MVETAPGDLYVRTKKRLSGFYPTDLEFLLRNLDVDNVVLTGTYTDACVLSTAFDAANRDFRVLVPRDVVAGYSEEAENAALLIVSLHLGLVVDSEPLVAEWKGRSLATRSEASANPGGSARSDLT
jgi:nicotinamidase-related amidase